MRNREWAAGMAAGFWPGRQAINHLVPVLIACRCLCPTIADGDTEKQTLTIKLNIVYIYCRQIAVRM